MAYISNAQVVKAFKLVKNIDLGFAKEYDLTKVLIDLDNLDNSRNNFWMKPTLDLNSAYYIKIDIIDDNNVLDKLYIPYVRNKLTWVVRRNKSITLIINKFEKVYVDL